MSKIVIFIDWYKPAYKAGGPVISISNMVNLLNDEIDFYIITSNKDINEINPLSNVDFNQWMGLNNTRVMYLDKQNQNIKNFKNLVNNISPDKIYLNGVFSWYFSILPLFLFRYKYQIIISPRGMLGESALKIKLFRKRVYLIIAKYFGLFKNVYWHASSKSEMKEIEMMFKIKKAITIIPNLTSIDNTNLKLNQKTIKSLRLISVCRLSPIKNIDFFLDVLSEIKFDCSYTLIGPDEDFSYKNKLIQKINNLPDNIKISFYGPISPKKVKEKLLEADIFVSSSKNENYGHSIVEALSIGLPVLISNKNPWIELNEYRAGFRIPLDSNLFLEKLNYFEKLDNDEFMKYKSGAINYYNNLMNPYLYKKDYIKLLTNKS